ncbi:hypothetical protein HDF17_001285 [Granulicella arctica]|uniref:Uncharacterized protein n=1 Tax=Granulicella arctica TaxID=940613 RepID=A0A7Y9PFJ5_9BACT|nr:hypothetical protein [Granulicella arctica]
MTWHRTHFATTCIRGNMPLTDGIAGNKGLLYLVFNDPHSLYVSSTIAAVAGRTWTCDEKTCASIVKFMDDGVGQVRSLAAL